MMPMTRRDLEILLDSPDRRDYVVSAYVDLRVKDGFRRDVDVTLRNLAREASEALSEAKARKSLEANLEPISRAALTADSGARGLAAFSGAERGLFHAVALDFPVETRLVIDEEPFLLPLLENWYGTPRYLVARIDSRELDLFEAHSGVTEPVETVRREIPEFQRDKPRFTYKKRMAQAWHERLHSLDEDEFFKHAAEIIAQSYNNGAGFRGLILMGQPPITAAARRQLPKPVEQAVIDERPIAKRDKPDDVGEEVSGVLHAWHERRTRELLDELAQRWKEHHHVADGPTDVLDALQQGRATQIVIGPRRDIAGARCPACDYRFGAPIATCVYCNSPTRTVSALQEILRFAMKQHVPVHVLDPNEPTDAISQHGDVVALTRADANWAPPQASGAPAASA
jgi:hypothetical protein